MVNKKDFSQFRWVNEPSLFTFENGVLSFTTEPLTDFWKRTYYGFEHDNAHAFIMAAAEEAFSFTVKAAWKPEALFDQCGVILYQDPANWFKASVEYDNEKFSRLGSVVTNLGFSDWATTDVDSTLTEMTYRLSRRGQDFLIENSYNGKQFNQMRIFHMHQAIGPANIGVYACSPLESSFRAVFSHFSLGDCLWDAYNAAV